MARALDISLKDADRIAKLIPDDLKMTLVKALEQEPELRALIDGEPRFRELYDASLHLEAASRLAPRAVASAARREIGRAHV